MSGIVTNLHGGWLGERFGLRITLRAGTVLQVGGCMGLWVMAYGLGQASALLVGRPLC